MSVDKRTLTLESDLLLNADDAVIQGVISNVLKCDKLILLGTARTFDVSFVRSSSYNEFLMKLEESVTTLEVHEGITIDLGKYLSNVRYLSIEKPGIFPHILLNLSKQHVALEEVSITENGIQCGLMEPYEMNINAKFFEMLESFRATLKSVTFKCSMPLQRRVIWKLCSSLNQILQGLDDVMFDCEPLPNFPFWIIEKIKIEFLQDENMSKLVVKPLFLREKSFEERQVQGFYYKRFYYKDVAFESASVERVHFDKTSWFGCVGYSFLDCFPVEVESLKNKIILHILNKKHLKDLGINVDLVNDTFPTNIVNKSVENLTLLTGFEKDTWLEKVIKVFPNLKKLSVKSSQYYYCSKNYTDSCVKIIAKTLKKLEYLHIDNDDDHHRLTSVSLDLIKHNLTKLKELHVNCSESSSIIEKLFEELPTLEVFSYGHSSLFRRFLERKPLPNDKNINDFPPELLEHIFLYLHPNEQRTCRQVCKYWFEIQKASLKVDHTLTLMRITKPITNIFRNTKFNYNLINFDYTTFKKCKDLTPFWEKIGSEVKEICIKNSMDYQGAERTGLRVEHFPKMKKFSFGEEHFCQLLTTELSEWKALLNQVVNFSIYVNSNAKARCCRSVKFSMSCVRELTVTGDKNKFIIAFFQNISFPKLETFLIVNLSECIEVKHLLKSNFTYIKTLYIGVAELLDDNDVDLISKECPNVECLGILNRTKIIPDTMVKNMFDKMLYLKDLYLVVIIISYRKKDYISFHRTDYGTEKSNKKCRVFDPFLSFGP